MKVYEVLFLVCGEDGYWIYIPEDYVEAHPDLKWVLTSRWWVVRAAAAVLITDIL